MAGTHDSKPWTTVWATAMVQSPLPSSAVRPMTLTAPALKGQTLRQMVLLSAGGTRIRIRLSNTFGRKPLRIDAASVGKVAAGGGDGQLNAASLHALRFDGRADVVVPPGAVRYSDPLDFAVRGGDTLGVSLYVAGAAAPGTWHEDAVRDNLISTPGNYTAKAAMPVAAKTGSTLWLSGVDVQADKPLSALVMLGDSITNGYHSTPGAANSYPEQLARRLRMQRPACRVAVLNAGIDGNEMSGRDGGYGPGEDMATRFSRDVLGQSGARFVLLLGGINDIGETTMALRQQDKTLDGRTVAANVIAAQQEVIAKAHAAKLRIFGATILPFEGTQGAYSEAGERARQQVNDWIRHRAGFDGVVDFDAVMRDPAHPGRIRADFDSGDHIHPNDKGYAAMSEAVPLSWFGCKP
ncbi:MAG: SGNH/GDSL hydrolase family protein [Rhodanobacter sp.]